MTAPIEPRRRTVDRTDELLRAGMFTVSVWVTQDELHAMSGWPLDDGDPATIVRQTAAVASLAVACADEIGEQVGREYELDHD